MICAKLILPRWIQRGIMPNDKGARMDKFIYGADSETLDGKPLSFQFYSEHTACDSIYFVNEKNAAKCFLEWCGRRKRGVQHVVYVHNLDFDLIEFLWGYHPKLVGPGGDFLFKVGSWTIRGVYGTPTFCRISNGHDLSITLINSFSFYRGSLAKAAEIFCPGLPKLARPAGLGEKKFTAHDKGFCRYAMRDAEVAFHIGVAIERLHVEFDLQQCVSVADLAARIFRHRFLSYTIPQPDREIIECALLSYHGGKNNITVPAGWYRGVTALDISSAYPTAMRQLPAFSNEKLYKRLRARNMREVPPHGVYWVSGTLAECQWPVIFSHSFKPLHGKIADIAVQGHELNAALASGEFKPRKIDGWYYDEEKDHQAPAFRGFVDDFYRRKETERDKVLRYMYKTILNSVYGKFIQTRKTARVAYVDIDAGTVSTASELLAGGMFHPFIASAITAHTRARIHTLEHKYKALHTATDGIFTQQKAQAVGRGLGSLTVEARGELLLVRNKCYILYSDSGDEKSWAFKGKKIAKYAKHGFQGSVHDLEKLVATGRRKYKVNRPHRLREAIKRGLTPNKFETREYLLKVGAIPLR